MISLLLFLLFAFLPSQHDSDGEIARLRVQWAQNLHLKHVEASVASYAEDGDFIQPDGTHVQGRAAIKALFQTVTTTFDSDLVFTSGHVEVSGDLAFDSGTYQETLVTRATGKSEKTQGSYLTVYRQAKDGVWLIVEQMWASSPGGSANAAEEVPGRQFYLSRATTKSGSQSNARLNSESSIGVNASRP